VGLFGPCNQLKTLLKNNYWQIFISSLLEWTHKPGDDFGWIKPGPEIISLTRLAASDIEECIGEHLSVAKVNSRIALLAHVFANFCPDALMQKPRIGWSAESSPTAANQHEIDISEYTNSLDALGDESTMTMSQLTGDENGGDYEHSISMRILAKKPQKTGTNASAGLYGTCNKYTLYLFCVYS